VIRNFKIDSDLQYNVEIPIRTPSSISEVRGDVEKLFVAQDQLIDVISRLKTKRTIVYNNKKAEYARQASTKTDAKEALRHDNDVETLETAIERAVHYHEMVTEMLAWYRSLHSSYSKELA